MRTHATTLGWLVSMAVCLLPRVAWVSGAISSKVLGRTYQVNVLEASYPIGEDPPPSAAAMKAQVDAMRARTASIAANVERWLETEVATKKLTLADVTLDTALPGPPSRDVTATKLKRTTLVELPRCSLPGANLLVEVRVASRTLPPAVEREALGKRLCAALHAPKDGPKALELVELAELHAPPGGPRITLEANALVPKPLEANVVAARKKLFDDALRLVQRSLAAAATKHGVRVVPPTEPNAQLVRYASDLPYGAFDVLFGVVGGKKGASLDVPMKDAIYDEWQKAGLPMQVSYEHLTAR